MTFLAPNIPGRDVVEPLESAPDFVDEATLKQTGGGAVFIFLPERAGELSWVQQAFPDGQVQGFYDTDRRLRFTIYQVPASSNP
jgi:hypothetical protein